MDFATFGNKMSKLASKGPSFYIRHKMNGVKNNSAFFGQLFKKFFKYYKTQGLTFDIGEDLFPVPLQSRFFFKVYEKEEVALLSEFLSGKETVLELGGCIGVVSCVTNSHLEDPGRHVIVEANPNLIPYLEKNRALNNSKFKILNAVVSENLTETFYTYRSALAGSLVKQPGRHDEAQSFIEISIQGMTPEDIEEKYRMRFDTLIMDVEGGEVELIRIYKDWIAKLNTIMVEMHPNIIEDEGKIRETISTIENYCELKLEKRKGQSYLFRKHQQIQ